MSSLSGWCPPDQAHESAHRVCQMRQNDPDERIRLRPCCCPQHGGHTTTIEGDQA